MDHVAFRSAKKKLRKSRKQLSTILGVTPQIIRSYENGWRHIPPHIAEKLRSLVLVKHSKRGYKKTYMNPKASRDLPEEECGCSTEQRILCPAWQLRFSSMSWFSDASSYFITNRDNWVDRKPVCHSCDLLQDLL